MEREIFKVENLSKSFGTEKGKDHVRIIRNISMSIREKEFIVILGDSGCGKSTFLKILAGIHPASGGNITLDGKSCGVSIPREELRKFGFVFQSDNLLQWLTAGGNLQFIIRMMKLKGSQWEKRVDEMLDLVGLLDYKHVYPHELSGGMKQRVGIARALVHDPEILVMDQPLGALDTITRKMLAFEVLNIWKKTQKTIIMVTNNVDEALLLASRIFIFSPLPAGIAQEFTDDIPIEERTVNISRNRRFNELRGEINALLRVNIKGGESYGK
ncbi:MAG: ABC transporter ATP-binding protein [Treponema sp.]|jgi:NitT/TauT family transport system ATP-binding protein|nr:ABC transporter ATP-binding protein [Treponema sp.]